MRKASRNSVHDLRPEYDFASMRGGVRGKYVRRYRAGTNLVLLEPDVAKAFPTDEAVNDALRAVLKVTSIVGRSRRPPNKTMQRSARSAGRR